MTFTLKTKHIDRRQPVIDKHVEIYHLDDVFGQRQIPDRIKEVLRTWTNHSRSGERIQLTSGVCTYTIESE